MIPESITLRRDRSLRQTVAGVLGTEGAAFVLAAATFFLGSGVLTQSGQPGASTPVPWMVSHVLWIVATALLAIGTVRLVRRVSSVRTGIAGYVASGLVGLGVLHTLQWATWVYVDVIAYQQGAHDLLSPPLFHPFGTGHMLMFAIILGGAIATLAWAVRRAGVTHRFVPWLGIAIGVLTLLAGSVSLLTFAPVRSPASLAAIVLQAGSFAWLFLLGVAITRRQPGQEVRR